MSEPAPRVPGFEWRPRGLFRVTSKPGQDGEPPKEDAAWIAPPFTLPGLVRDEVSDGWRLLIAWKDLDGITHEEAIPFEMLSGEGLELGRMLGQGGMVLPSEIGARKALLSYLSKARPKVKNRVRLVGSLGWHEGAFVLPGGQVIGQASEVLRFAGRQIAGHREHTEPWKGGSPRWPDTPWETHASASPSAAPLRAPFSPWFGRMEVEDSISKGSAPRARAPVLKPPLLFGDALTLCLHGEPQGMVWKESPPPGMMVLSCWMSCPRWTAKEAGRWPICWPWEPPSTATRRTRPRT